MALTTERHTTRHDGTRYSDPVAADTKIFAGALVVLNAAGDAAPGSTATGLTARGVAAATADNTGGAAGDIAVDVRKGVFRFNNSAGADEITRAEIGDDCYIVDDETVAKTDGSISRSVAGEIVDVDSIGVWVRFA